MSGYPYLKNPHRPQFTTVHSGRRVSQKYFLFFAYMVSIIISKICDIGQIFEIQQFFSQNGEKKLGLGLNRFAQKSHFM